MVAAEYQEHFGDHAYDEEGNYIGTGGSEGQQAWEDYFSDEDGPEHDDDDTGAGDGSAFDAGAPADET